MAKLGIIYKIKEHGWTDLESSELATMIENANCTLYIGTKETRTLKQMINEITLGLRRRKLLNQDEELEIDDFCKTLMQYEEEKNELIKGDLIKTYYSIYLTERGRFTC